MPFHRSELLLSQLASNHDLRQKSDSHPRKNTLLDGFNTGELGDVLRFHICERQLHVELLAVSAAGLCQEQRLIQKIRRKHLLCTRQWMIRCSKEIHVFVAHLDGTKLLPIDLIRHADGEIDLSALEFARQLIVRLWTEDKFHLGISLAKLFQ